MVITSEGAVTVWNLTVMELTVTGSITALYRTMNPSAAAAAVAQSRKAPVAAAAADSAGGSSSNKGKGTHTQSLSTLQHTFTQL
jgi:hypothetical protein